MSENILKTQITQSFLKRNIKPGQPSTYKVKFILKNFPTEKTPSPNDFTIKFYPNKQTNKKHRLYTASSSKQKRE